MKECKNCGNKFPTKVVIGGKKRNLQRRKYCLNCSPFGSRNVKKLHLGEDTPYIEELGKKICTKCSKEKDLSSFYLKRRKKQRNSYTSWCIKCFKEDNLKKIRDMKQKCIDYKGGSCYICGYDKCLGSLHFHHVDPSQKDFGIAKNRNLSWERIKPELDKTVLVCANCHGEIHYEEETRCSHN